MTAAVAPGEVFRLRIVVIDPPAGVGFAMQRGHADLVAPSVGPSGELLFDFELRTGKPLADGRPNLLGEFAQGTPAGRFVYINSGKRAGQAGSPWERRAKIMLAGIDGDLLARAARDPSSRIEARIRGVGRDGGPVCATTPTLDGGWRLAR